MQSSFKFILAIASTCVIGLLGGCSAMRPDADSSPEYRSARDAIESYEDSEGNYVRPEGRKAEKRKNSLLGSTKRTTAPTWLGGKPEDHNKAREEFAKGEEMFLQATKAEGEERKEQFRKAAKQFKTAAKYWPSSALEQDAWLMAGESHFFAEEYPKSEDMYVKLFGNYPRTHYEDLLNKRRMEIGLYWIRHDRAAHKPFYVMNFFDEKRPWNDTGNHGKRVLEKMRLDSPVGPLTDDATMELANNAFIKGEYEGAAEKYQDLRATYLDSPHQFDAHFLGLKAEMQTYAGHDYDGQALDRAEKLLKQIHRQFPEQAKEHEDYLRRSYAEIQYLRAERLYVKSQYYMNKGANKAAAQYLQEIGKKYSETPFAEEAKTDLARIGELPGDPEQHLKWLADMVPHNDPVSRIRRDMNQGDPSPMTPDKLTPMNDSTISNIASDNFTNDGPKEASFAKKPKDTATY